MNLFGKKDPAVAVASESPVVAKKTNRELRLEAAFGTRNRFSFDSRVALLPKSEAVQTSVPVLFDGGSSQLQCVRTVAELIPIDPVDYLTELGKVVVGKDWKSTDFRALAADAVVGMQHSLERGFENQAKLHRKALLRALSRDVLLSAGFQTEEIRFRPSWSQGGSGMSAWQILPRSLEGAENHNSAESHRSYEARTLESEFYRIDITPLSSSRVRVSGTAFEILELLDKMPEGVVEDVFVADILEKRVDPVLIVQIAGYSYIVHAWDE